MKRYKVIFATLAVATVVYYEHSFHEEVRDISSIVTETNEIVKEVKSILKIPYDMDNDYHCLASNIYWESRNQSLVGQMAVGQVAINRVDSDRYPESICGVVKQTKYYPSGGINLHDCQFSWYCDGKSDLPLEREQHIYEESFNLAVQLIDDRPLDVTEGSTHYHNDKVLPYWAKGFEHVTQIDNHIFYRSE